jgi:hypothetical protein
MSVAQTVNQFHFRGRALYVKEHDGGIFVIRHSWHDPQAKLKPPGGLTTAGGGGQKKPGKLGSSLLRFLANSFQAWILHFLPASGKR